MKYPYLEENTWKMMVSEEIKSASVKVRRRLSDDEVRLVVRGMKKDLLIRDTLDDKEYQQMRREKSLVNYSKPSNFYFKPLNSYTSISKIFDDYLYFLNTKFENLSKELELRNRTTVKNFLRLMVDKKNFEAFFNGLMKMLADKKKNSWLQSYSELMKMNLDTLVAGIIYSVSDKLLHFKLDTTKFVLYDNVVIIDRKYISLFSDSSVSSYIYDFYNRIYELRIEEEVKDSKLNFNLIKDDRIFDDFLDQQKKIKDELLDHVSCDAVAFKNQCFNKDIIIRDEDILFNNKRKEIINQFEIYSGSKDYRKMKPFVYNNQKFDLFLNQYLDELVVKNLNSKSLFKNDNTEYKVTTLTVDDEKVDLNLDNNMDLDSKSVYNFNCNDQNVVDKSFDKLDNLDISSSSINNSPPLFGQSRNTNNSFFTQSSNNNVFNNNNSFSSLNNTNNNSFNNDNTLSSDNDKNNTTQTRPFGFNSLGKKNNNSFF